MSDKLTIYKNKGELFKCHFKIDGAEAKDTTVRLCLEFDDLNYFFYGDLKDNGECIIEIPRLNQLEDKDGKLTVEAIADSVYFKVYETSVELRNSVEVKMQTPEIKETVVPKIKMDEFVQTEPKINPYRPIKSFNEYSKKREK